MSGFCDINIKKKKYNLTGIVEHIGNNSTKGHFVAYIKKKWFYIDDDKVTTIQQHHAMNAEAYMLFYKMKTYKHKIDSKTKRKQEDIDTESDTYSNEDYDIEEKDETCCNKNNCNCKDNEESTFANSKHELENDIDCVWGCDDSTDDSDFVIE